MSKTLRMLLAFWCCALFFLFTQGRSALINVAVVQASNEGRILAIGVEVEPTILEWGTIHPNITYSRSFNVTNSGNSNITLTLECGDWQPSEFPLWIDLVNDYDGQIIEPFAKHTVTLNLTVDPDFPKTITTFSFTITVAGQES